MARSVRSSLDNFQIFFISFTNTFVYTCVLAGYAGYAGAYPVAPPLPETPALGHGHRPTRSIITISSEPKDDVIYLRLA
jgi:hypothetical protein